MIPDNNSLFDSVKTSFKELLSDDDPDVDMDTLVQSLIISIYEELDLYSVVGTIPLFINDGNNNFTVFISLRQNREIVILSIEKVQD